MRSLPLKLAAALTTAFLLTACGGSDESPDSSGADEPRTSEDSSAGTESPSQSGEPTKTPSEAGGEDEPDDRSATTVARERFCSDVDTDEVGRILDLDDVQVLADREPGEKFTLGAGQAPSVSSHWTCSIGETSGNSVAVTWNIGDAKAKPHDGAAVLKNLQDILGPDNCETTDDEALGPGTRGIDCGGSTPAADSAVAGFTTVARTAVVDQALLECYVASTSPDDLDNLAAAAPEVCALFRAHVVR